MSQAGILSDSTTAAADIEFLTGDVGGALGPDAAHNFNLIGTAAQGISTSGAGNTITWTISDAAEAQKGVIELATNAESVAGTDTVRGIVPTSLKAKLGAQTANGMAYGAGDTAAIAWTAAAIDGQILIGDTGSNPLLGNIGEGTGITVTNGGGTISIASTGASTGTGQTIGAVTDDLITIALGGTAGVYQIQASVAGFDSATPAGAIYRLTAGVRTTGAAGTLIGTVDKIVNEEAAVVAADATIVISGNSAIVRVTGVAGLTLDYTASAQQILVT